MDGLSGLDMLAGSRRVCRGASGDLEFGRRLLDVLGLVCDKIRWYWIWKGFSQLPCVLRYVGARWRRMVAIKHSDGTQGERFEKWKQKVLWVVVNWATEMHR